jgi:hypothetical protein
MLGAILFGLYSSMLAHPTTWALGSAYVFTAMINSLPEPGSGRPVGAMLYQWLYDFLHVLSNRVVQKYPQMSVPAHQVTAQIPAQNVSMHPGQTQPPPSTDPQQGA